ncbi:predicted protein [Naegleria gruberi]|uniref:Predicted protein n=1 Tax=Naegleria gruberi TaxID=5762 RepID=D2W435_NAEGR|nr:uncharacterized protein NAEGRDRAFT_82292 [Naegleria gruberi]EFC36174.1 predicted protein [Naegleria gruberi]|eukprot:XP_002668918.1 predicted protein [Naegleria gruberi strain NEG-M]
MPTNNSSPSSLMTNQDSPTSVSTELMEDANGSSSVSPQNVDPMNSRDSFFPFLPSTYPSRLPTTVTDISSLYLRTLASHPPSVIGMLAAINSNNAPFSINNNNNNNSHESINVANLDEQPLQQLVSPKPEEKELFDLSKHDIIPPTITTENCEIPHNFICPITKLIMFSPVRNMYGKVYERESIDQWWKTLSSKQQQLTDPLTNQVVSDKALVEDVELKNQIQEFLNQNAHLRFSINDLYFPKQIIREMKVAIDSENYAKISHLLSQFPANFFVQTKFPVPPQSAQGKTKNEKETSVSVFDCLYRRFKTVFDSVKDASPSDVHFMNDPIIGYVVRQYLIVRNYFIERQKKSISKIEVTEFKSAESSISEGLKNIFVNSVRLFPNVSILDWLVSIGASISSTNQFKQNAFHMACMTDQVEIAKHLCHLNNLVMTNNASSVNIVEERLSDEVKRKWNAFYLAIWHNSQKIIDWVVDDAHLSQRFLLRKHKCMVKDKSSIYHPMNALSLAAYKKNIPLMEVLIKKFSFEVPDEKYHPIYWSCIANDLNGFKWICNYIETNIPNGAEIPLETQHFTMLAKNQRQKLLLFLSKKVLLTSM